MSENSQIYKTMLKQRESVYSLLDQLQLIEAGELIKEMMSVAGIPEYKEHVDRELQTFKYLLHYTKEKLPDPNRNLVISSIVEHFLTLSDLAVRALSSKDNSNYYYSTLRFLSFRQESLPNILKHYGEVISELQLLEAAGEDVKEKRKIKESIVEQLFNSIFTSLGDEKSIKDLGAFLMSGYAEYEVSSVALSALTLALLQFYEKGKLELLIELFENNKDPKISAKALVGILFTFSLYSDRIGKNPSLMARLELWKDSLDIYSKLRHAVRMFIGTQDTDRISSKLNNEVLPELMKLRPEILNKLKDIKDSEIDSETLEEFTNNPEWENMLENSGISEKLKELADLQNEGADLMMVTFSRLKQFPFFNSAVNWFIPFDLKNTTLNLPEQFESLLQMMMESGSMICDSDLYSLALAAASMPEMQRNMIMSQLQMHREQMNENLKSSTSSGISTKFDTELQKTLRDYYRFFKLFRKKEGLNDPFSSNLKFYSFPVLGDILRESEVLEVVAEFYFKHGYYKEALPLLELITEEDNSSSINLEKIGFCLQSLGKLKESYDVYVKASLLKTPGPWLTRKLAFLSKSLGLIDEAIGYYRNLLEMEGENGKILMNLAHLLVEKKEYAEALQHYYHANYLTPESSQIMRAIAWVELLNGNFNKSIDYYYRIISKGEPTRSDYLNLGHANFLINNRREAINYYRLAAENNISDFKKEYLKDKIHLENSGLSETDIFLMLEIVLN